MKNDDVNKATLYGAELHLKAENTACDICGKKFYEMDAQEDAGWNVMVGYGSKYDTYNININLCADCYDKILDEFIVPNCKTNPIIDEEPRYCGQYGPLEAAREHRIKTFLGGDTDHKIWKAVRDGEVTDNFLDEIENDLREKGYKV